MYIPFMHNILTKSVSYCISQFESEVQEVGSYEVVEYKGYKIAVKDKSKNFIINIIDIVEEKMSLGSVGSKSMDRVIESSTSFKNAFVVGAFCDPHISDWINADDKYLYRYAAFFIHNKLLAEEFMMGNTTIFFGKSNTGKKEELRKRAFSLMGIEMPQEGHEYE